MALSETLSETSICNMALGRIGSKRGTTGEMSDVETDTTVQGIYCRQHYEQTRNALLESYRWRFAMERAALSDTDIEDPTDEYSYVYQLPDNFLRLVSIYEESARTQYYKYALEGEKFYTNEDEINIRYIKKVTDVSKFTPLFIEVFVLKLARKLAMPLTQGNGGLELIADIDNELTPLLRKTNRMDFNERQRLLGRNEMDCWNEARVG